MPQQTNEEQAAPPELILKLLPFAAHLLPCAEGVSSSNVFWSVLEYPRHLRFMLPISTNY